MPTYKEISKLRDEAIKTKEDNLRGKLSKIESKFYNDVLKAFLDKLDKAPNGNIVPSFQNTILLAGLENSIKDFSIANQTPLLKGLTNDISTLIDLNEMYFNAIDKNPKIAKIKDKAIERMNNRLGINSDGTLKQNGFIAKTVQGKQLQKKIVKEVTKAITKNQDYVAVQKQLKDLVITTDKATSVFERYYKNNVYDIFAQSDRIFQKSFANDLGYQHFTYGGGLITTSRSFCMERNGKMFSVADAEKWKDTQFIKDMYKDNIDSYDPLVDMGGYRCRHQPNWISKELYDAEHKEQNIKATERTKKFKDRNNL